jgi:undecaprenyl-phosphate galactose phosphotransferase
MYSFKTILIWEELKKQLRVHTEYILVMVVNDLAFLDVHYVYAHIIMGILFMGFNLIMIKIIRRVFVNDLSKNLLIVGTGRKARILTEIIGENKFTMYNLLGYVSVHDLDVGCEQDQIDKKEIICDYKDLEKIIEGSKIDEIIVALPKASSDEMKKIMECIEGKVDKIKFVPELNGVFTFNSKVEDYDGVLMISASNGIMSSWQKIIKRGIDIAGGLVGTFILLPLTFYVWMKTEKKERRAGIFFKQPRIAIGGDSVEIIKYRSMIVNAEKVLEEMMEKYPEVKEEYLTNKKLKDDPRVTSIGAKLRKTSLDEFPQFLNVLKGEMSMVGPRPYLHREKEDMGKKYNKIINLKPGITGMWQAHGRSETTFDERLELDEYYYRNWSVWLDVVIIIKTIKSVMKKEGAY